MTSEPDTPPRRPPTIELSATEVGAEQPAAAAGSGEAAAADGLAQPEAATDQRSAAPASGGADSGLVTSALSVAAGAVGAFTICAGLWFGGYVPSRTVQGVGNAPSPPGIPPAAETSAAPKNVPSVSAAQQPATAQQPSPTQPPAPTQQSVAALVDRVTAAEAAAKSLGDGLAALNRRVDDVAGAAQAALAQAKAAAAAADAAKTAAQGGAARSDLETLAGRVATLQDTVKKLADDVERQGATADDRAARRIVVTEALRAAVERGVPYQAELAAAKSLGIDGAAIAAIEPLAAAGVPSAATLAHELAALVPALQQAVEPAGSDGTFLGRLENNAQRLVHITPVDAPPGDDPASVVTRINVDAAHANIAAALADIAKLPEAARPIAAAWVQRAQAQDAALLASRKLAADALAALGKTQ